MRNLEIISENAEVLAIYIPEDFLVGEEIRFFTSNKEEFQFGGMKRLKGDGVLKHRHNPQTRILSKTSEFLFIKRGSCQVNVFSNEFESKGTAEPIASITCKSGDMILLLRGAHSIEFLEDSYIFELKQGPFQQGKDKELLHDFK